MIKILNKLGIYILVFWSNNRLYPKAKTILGNYSNQYKYHTYRITIVYLNKKERVFLNKSIIKGFKVLNLIKNLAASQKLKEKYEKRFILHN